MVEFDFVTNASQYHRKSSRHVLGYQVALMKILTAQEMREVDRLTTERYGIPGLTLMENAGAGVARFIAQHWPDYAQRRIVVLCGKGNNGGDGFVAARHLRDSGARPEVYLLAAPDEMRGDAATNCKRWQETYGDLACRFVIPARGSSAKPVLATAEIIVDALLGTGTRGALAGLLAEVVEEVNQRRGPIRSAVVAVDIPSGLVADTGEANGPVVKAAYTVTFTAPKIGMTAGASSDYVGQLIVRDIGSPPELIEEVGKSNIRWIDAREMSQFALPRRADGNKGSYGHALIVAGSRRKKRRGGAGVLGRAARGRRPRHCSDARAGAADRRRAHARNHDRTAARHRSRHHFHAQLRIRALRQNREREARPRDRPGTDHARRNAAIRSRGRREAQRADGSRCRWPERIRGTRAGLKNPRNGPIALTPHPGEMARLLGCEIKDVQARRLEVARKSAADWNAFVILKGHQTVIASPDGQLFINSTGNPGMGTGGTGDVLTGMLAGLTAQFGTSDWVRVLAFGVYLHGLAGDIAYADTGEAPLLASDLIHAIPRAYQQFYADA